MSCNLTTTKPTNRPATRLAGLAAALVLAGGAQAQQGGSATKPAPVLSSPLPAGAGTAVPSGSGAGYHSPDSPIAPLPQRSDVVPWSVLADLTR